MTYQVLARKYRPQTLEDVLGQDHVTTTLRNAIAGDRVAHAYLFTGARGVGKTTSARILAKALNCEQGPTATPCNACENCREITEGRSLDVFEIDAASNTGVDNVRELQEGLRYMPGKSRHKVYIIDEVHMLSGSAFNALLKTLEEPPPHVRFIFATTEPHKIPVTILSRCQRFDFKRLSRMKIIERLKSILELEQVSATDGALQLIAREAEGSMRDAQSLTDQALSFGAGKLDERTVAEALGVIDRNVLNDAVVAILGGDAQRLLELVDQVYDFGYDVRQFTRNLLEHFRNLLVVRVSDDSSHLVDLPKEDIDELRRQGQPEPIDRLHRLFSSLLKLADDVVRSSHPRMVLEVGLVRVATLGPLQPVEELLGRIRDLSDRPPPIAGGLAGAVPAPNARPPVTMPPPVRSKTPTEEAPPAAPQEAVTPGHALLAFLESRLPRLGAKAHNLAVEENGDAVVLKVPKEQAPLVLVLKAGMAEELRQAVRAYYNRDMSVDVLIDGSSPLPAMSSAPQPTARKTGLPAADGPEARERKRGAIDHPAVQEVLRVFDAGRIVDVQLLTEAIRPAVDDESIE